MVEDFSFLLILAENLQHKLLRASPGLCAGTLKPLIERVYIEAGK
jgi:hypothetical protein